MRQTLFELGDFTLHSGAKATYKIECDALTDEDWAGLAHMVSLRTKQIAMMCSAGEGTGINRVHGVPRGGVKFAEALQKYAGDTETGVDLIVDDVLTTGNSMEEAKRNLGWSNAHGVVVFARDYCPSWVQPIFSMSFFK